MRGFTKYRYFSKPFFNYCHYNNSTIIGRRSSNDSTSILTDNFGRFHNYLRISITERCNLRCTYCMPEEGVDLKPNDKLLTTDEIIKLSQLFVESGVDKIRLTGGEPTVRKDLIPLVERLGQIEGLKTIAMTSNGIVLQKKLPDLIKAGLNLINISLDTFDEDKFTLITRRLGWSRVMDSINLSKSYLGRGLKALKVNCVVTRGVNDDEIIKFVEWTRNEPIEVRFIEYMPFDGNTWNDKRFLSYIEMIDMIKQAGYNIERGIDPGPNETSKSYKIPNFAGSIGFISSMSEHFCNTCNRLRLMADGSLKVCLFGRTEISLRDHLREGSSDTQLKEIIKLAVQKKKASHDGMYEIDKKKQFNRPMILIGG